MHVNTTKPNNILGWVSTYVMDHNFNTYQKWLSTLNGHKVHVKTTEHDNVGWISTCTMNKLMTRCMYLTSFCELVKFTTHIYCKSLLGNNAALIEDCEFPLISYVTY